MSEDKEFRAGALSGLLAVVLVVMLSVMAMTTLQPDHAVRTADAPSAAQGVDSR